MPKTRQRKLELLRRRLRLRRSLPIDLLRGRPGWLKKIKRDGPGIKPLKPPKPPKTRPRPIKEKQVCTEDVLPEQDARIPHPQEGSMCPEEVIEEDIVQVDIRHQRRLRRLSLRKPSNQVLLLLRPKRQRSLQRDLLPGRLANRQLPSLADHSTQRLHQ